jgi:hypothetical protein
MTTTPAWTNMTIFAVIIVIVAFSMFMGRRSNDHRARGGWWAGLVVLLIILSGFFGIQSFRMRSVQEVRHAGRVWPEGVRTEIEERVQTAREDVENALEQAKKAMGSAMRRDDKSKQKNRVEVRSGPPTAIWTTTNQGTVVFDVTLPSGERAQSPDQLEQKLKQRGAARVAEWVQQNLPYRTWGISEEITPDLLEKKGAFPEKIDARKEVDVPRLDYESTGLKDTLYNGVLKVVLQPDVQQHLMNLGFTKLDERLKEEKFMQQGIIFIILMITTLSAGGIGTLCYLHRWWQSRGVSTA